MRRAEPSGAQPFTHQQRYRRQPRRRQRRTLAADLTLQPARLKEGVVAGAHPDDRHGGASAADSLGAQGGQSGSELQTPMAIVILCGLATSTLLNMFVVPTLYLKLGHAST